MQWSSGISAGEHVQQVLRLHAESEAGAGWSVLTEQPEQAAAWHPTSPRAWQDWDASSLYCLQDNAWIGPEWHTPWRNSLMESFCREYAGVAASGSQACEMTLAEQASQSLHLGQQGLSNYMFTSGHSDSQLVEADEQFACMFGQYLGSTIDARVGGSTAGSPGVQNVSFPCFTKWTKQGSGHEVKKRSLRRARRRAAAQGQTTYRGRTVTPAEIGMPGEKYTEQHQRYEEAASASTNTHTASLASY